MKKFIITLLAAGMIFSSAAELAVAKSYSTLPQAVWVQKPNVEYVPIHEELFDVPGKNTVYMHMGEEKASATKVWMPDILRAVDSNTGKVKWTFSFAKPGYGWPSTEDAFSYAPDGTVYAYFASEQLLYAVNASGKESWSKQLSADIPYSSKLYRLADGTLLIAGEKSNKMGAESVQLIGFDKNGKQKFNKVISGKLVTVTNSQIVIEIPTKVGQSMKVDVYNASLKRVFQYAFPKGTYVNFYTTFSLSDGTIIFPTTSGQKNNKLIALSPNGKALWGRPVPQQSLAFSAGKGYFVFQYSSKKLGYYDQKGLVKERTLTNYVMAEGDILPKAQVTADGKLLVDLISRQYVLDPKTLASIHEFAPSLQGTILDYRNNSVIVYNWDQNQISKHLLK